MVRLLPTEAVKGTYDVVSFNPTMVRLLHDETGLVTVFRPKFQSHNGAIAAERYEQAEIAIRCFNPTMVRLLQLLSTIFVKPISRFNPTMVRLLHFTRTKLAFETVAFQSHNGAIAAKLGHNLALGALLFQSHNGAIAA